MLHSSKRCACAQRESRGSIAADRCVAMTTLPQVIRLPLQLLLPPLPTSPDTFIYIYIVYTNTDSITMIAAFQIL